MEIRVESGDMKDEQENKKPPKRNFLGLGIVLGIVFGVVFDNIALGITFGVVFGVVMSARRSGKD